MLNKNNRLLLLLLSFVYFINHLVLKNKQLFLSLQLGHINSIIIEVNVLIDIFRSLFLTTVLIISFSVFRFRYIYIAYYKFYRRFHILLFVFVCSILMLIISSNLLFTIIGWDGLGVSSYLLVIFYGSRKSYNAGILTVLRNRLGDVFIMLCMGYIIHIGSWNINFYKEILNFKSHFRLILVLGAFTKSTQIPFRAWLPAAMAAPTPVSALVHSSTLVTAGIYVLIRLFNSLPQELYMILSWFGAVTIILARFRALKETDGKKIVALSTLSQLGVMMTGFRFNLPSLVFFHLLSHAFFKALLFIRTGFVIHNFNNYQNLRLIGGRRKWMSINSRIIIATKLRLAGLPFFAGFYSKEALLETLRSGTRGLVITYSLIVVGVVLTVLYSLRFLFSRSYFSLRMRVAGYSRLKSNSLVIRRLILFSLSIVSGKKLFFVLAPFSIIPILTFSRKLFITVLLLSGGWWYFFSSRASSRNLKFYRFMWGLPIFAGGLILKGRKRIGIKLVKALGFSYLDHVIGPWTLQISNYNRLMTTHRSSSIQKTLVLLLILRFSGVIFIY